MKKRIFYPEIAGFILLCVSIAVACWPLLKPGYFVSDDGAWMVVRLSAFYQSLTEGQFPVRVLGRLNANYGYPVANFLYPGYLYLGSLLHILRLSFIDSIKVIFAGSVLASGVLLYRTLRKRFDGIASAAGAINFVLSPYILFDIYRRGSVGEVLAFVPATMVLWVMTSRMYWLLPFAVTFLIVSHNTLALLFGLCFGVLSLFRPDRSKLLLGALLGLGMAGFFWIPAIAEQRFVVFALATISDPRQYFVSGKETILLGVPVILGLLFALGLLRKKDDESRQIGFITFAAYVFALPVSVGIWMIPGFARLVQFPYRFLSITTLFGSWLVAYVTSMLTGWRKGIFLVVCLLCWAGGAWLLEKDIVFVSEPLGYYTTNEATTTVADEYMPVWVAKKPIHRAVDPLEVLSGNAKVAPVDSSTMHFSVDAKESSLIQINKIYYPGWGVTIDGILVPTDHENALGVMRITVPNGIHDIRIAFRETLSRFVADLISLCSFILTLILLRRLQKQT